ncbi:MAG TPA: hypothetical protein VGN72_04330 [Tepidisphaeraceae bacterium]|jgi:hypothetical protein|nr:hypothetical protein [Tepidisphaeraceae bacterium]
MGRQTNYHVDYLVIRHGGGTQHATEAAAIDEAAKHSPGFVMRVMSNAHQQTKVVQRVWPTVGPAIEEVN